VEGSLCSYLECGKARSGQALGKAMDFELTGGTRHRRASLMGKAGGAKPKKKGNPVRLSLTGANTSSGSPGKARTLAVHALGLA
jgi:hypothetical protein